MAALDTYKTVQVVNVDLATERQNLLRAKLEEFFAALSRKARVKKRVVYTANTEESPLDKVLRMNEEADAVFTAFNYDKMHSDAYKDSLTVETPQDQVSIDPQLRYPLIAEYQRLANQGHFRHRSLVLVGDLHEKIGQYIRSALPVFVTVYTDPERKAISDPVQITSLERLESNPQAVPGELADDRPIPISTLATLQVAGIFFQGVINMPEEGNQFVFKDQTLVDTVRKLYRNEGVQAQMARARVAEEKLSFVRGKKVFILLDPDLEHIISERFQFDRMDNLYRHHTMEEALKTLESGKAQGILDYFEREGYGIVFDLLDQSERDKLLAAVLGDKLPGYLRKEIEAVKPQIKSLEESDLESIFYNLPVEIIDQTLEGLKEKNYERFLSMVPPKMREAVILEFLKDKGRVQAAWAGIAPDQQKEILNAQAHLIHAIIYLLDTNLSKMKFRTLKFHLEQNYNSTQFAKMNPDEQKAAFTGIARNIASVGAPKGQIVRQLAPEAIVKIMVEFIVRHPAEFYNRLDPLVRKQIWVTVGQKYRDHISGNLHALDKLEIVKGNMEASTGLLFSNPGFFAFLKSDAEPEFTALLFMTLKKLNKAESKSALLKRVLEDPAWKFNRYKGIPALLGQPDNGLIYEKLSERVEDLVFAFDSLVCTKAHFRELEGKEPLRGAVVTLVDDLVDPSLYNLFSGGRLSREEYDEFSRKVDSEIGELRRKLGASEAEDPVGVYILETMQILHKLSNETLTGGIGEESLAALDDRAAVRQRLQDSMKEHVRRIDDYLEKAERQLPKYEGKIASTRKISDEQALGYEREYTKARVLIDEYKQYQTAQAKAMEGRKKVALTQKELSVEFFQLIQPLILEKVRALDGPLKSLMRKVGLGKKDDEESSSQRVIFKFSDEEIERILKYKIVFCAKDPVLAQFVATCLRIDKLEGSLFTLASSENLPAKADIDILFYGPGYSVDDFSGSVKENRMVPFADETFYARLLENEKLKSRTKAVLQKSGEEMKARKPALETASKQLKGLQANRAAIDKALGSLEQEKVKLAANLTAQKEKRLHFAGEQELLESRLSQVDNRFDDIKKRVFHLVERAGGEGQPGDTAQAVTAGKEEMADQLRGDLTELNKELARMMFIKGVKDAGESISKNTQQEILVRIEHRETYDYAKHPFKKMIVADDGSNTGQNLKRVFVNTALSYFKLRDMAVQEVSIKRMLSLAENSNGVKYPFVAMFSERAGDDYVDLKLTVKKIRNLLPETYQMVITPFGQLGEMDRASQLYKNLLSLKDNCTLINADIGSFDDPSAMLKVLQEKAPLPRKAAG